MKKRKPPEQHRPDFSNNPFSSLKKFKPPDEAPRPARKSSPPRATEADEADLFRRAVSGARRLEPEGEPEGGRGRAPEKSDPEGQDDEALFLRAMWGAKPVGGASQVPAKAAIDEEDRGLFVNALRKMGTRLPPDRTEEDGDAVALRSSSSRIKQLRRGTIRISEELDLHGSLRDEALGKLKVFIANAFARGQRAVLVITGKGINSAEGPVLQGVVADWLRGPGKGMVAEFCPAPRDRGGSGAYVVFLKNR